MSTPDSDNLIFSSEAAIFYSGWDSLREYLSKMEKALQEGKVKFEAWVQSKTDGLKAEEVIEFKIEYVEEYYLYQIELPNILRNSFLVSAVSLLEYKMNMICKKLEKAQQIPIGWKDLKGNMLERARRYFKVAQLDLSHNEQIWQEIVNYFKVRNCIVHANGSLEGQKHDLISYVTEKGIISKGILEQEIALTEKFCEEAVETMQKFIDAAYEVSRRKATKAK